MNKYFISKFNNSYAVAKKASADFPCNDNVILKHTIELVCFFVIVFINITFKVLSILITQINDYSKETLPAIC